MATRAEIGESLPRCFPLPRQLMVGDQTWTMSYSSLKIGRSGTVSLLVLLSGPYQRFRQARLTLSIEPLLASRYDPSLAADAIRRWLPQSEANEVLAISAADLTPPADLADPAHDEI